MDIMHKMDQDDYFLEYYFVVILSLLTFRKIKRIEEWKAELKIKKEENSSSKV